MPIEATTKIVAAVVSPVTEPRSRMIAPAIELEHLSGRLSAARVEARGSVARHALAQTALLSKERIVIVPIINPDGFISSRDAFDLGDQMGYDPNVTLVESVGNG